MSCDLHRHTSFSSFDGFGKPEELAKLAKELGHDAIGISDHGNTNGLVQMWDACMHEGIKPILGTEGYMLPVYKPQHRGYHLCIFCKDLQGYENLNRLQYDGEKQKYYNPIWTFELLRKYHDGLICTTACVAGYAAQCIVAGKEKQAEKFLLELQDIFGEDVYIEIQPYKISEEGLQEKVNKELYKLGKKLGIKCILTSDSHRGAKDDFDTYLKMHQIKKDDEEWLQKITDTYYERYMPAYGDLERRFIKMHKADYKNVRAIAKELHDNLEELEDKVENDILGQLKLQLPKVDSNIDSWKAIVEHTKQGLKDRGKYKKKYIDRCKKELDVIKHNGFIDYFLIVEDYVNWAKNRGIVIGHGRGSVCNCEVAYALHITEVDSIEFDLDFRRFMRYDKKAFPDIDLDYETDRRGEGIEYLIKKYPNQSARVSSYGLYAIDNTINDLAKICGLPTDKEVEAHEVKANKETIREIKALLRRYKTEDGKIDKEALYNGDDATSVMIYNKLYDNIIKHFCKLFGKVRYIGTHAAGVVLTSGNIFQYTTLRTDNDGNIYSAYNLEDLDKLNIVKFDLLGLRTMQSLGELRRLTHTDASDTDLFTKDEEVLKAFRDGRTCGVFQLESRTAKRILDDIHCDSFNDIIAASSMNRPASLEQGMPDIYAKNKAEDSLDENDLTYKYTKETYGAIIYQEQLMLICVDIGGFEWTEADKMLKAIKKGTRERAVAILDKYKQETGTDLHKKFLDGATAKGMDRDRAMELWESLLVYSFNKGHATGYSLITAEEMYYKVHYPIFFWYVKIKYAQNDSQYAEFCNEAAKDDCIIFLPHVNYSKEKTSLRKLEGEPIIQQGMADVKGIGEKAAAVIYQDRVENGIYTSYDDFYDRMRPYSRTVTKKVFDVLKETGALEFNKKLYIKRVTAYNTALYSRGLRQ